MIYLPRRLLTRSAGLGVVVIWSSCFVAIRGTEGAAPPLLYAGLRASAAALVLLVIAGASGRLRPPAGTRWWLAALGVTNTTVGLAGMFLSVKLAGATLPAVLANSQALLVAPFAAWLFAERLDRKRVGGLIIGFGGVTVTVTAGSTGGGDTAFSGLLLGIMAAVGLAGGSIIIKHLAGRVHAITGVAWQFAVGAAGLLVWSLLVEQPWDVQWGRGDFLVGVLYLGIVVSAGASWAWYRLLQEDELVPLNALTMLTPTLSFLLAWFLYRETVGKVAWMGIAATLLGVAVVSLPRRSAGAGNIRT